MSAITRRDLAGRAGGAALGASLLVHARSAFGATTSDAQVIAHAVGLEQVAVFAYRSALASKLLDAPTATTFRLFQTHEEAHRDSLLTALHGFGGKGPAPPTSPASNPLLAPLAKARSQKDLVTFAIGLETAIVAAYYDATGQLQSPALLQSVAEIVGNEGQHLVVLRTALGQLPVPNAFETGKPASG
jgi:rubrerythrin